MKQSNALILILTILLFSLGVLSAIDIPLYVKWQSLNYISENTNQPGKETSWNELYQALIGISPITAGPAEFSLNLVTNRLFHEPTITVQDIQLGYRMGSWLVSGKSAVIGHGTGFMTDNNAGLRRGYDIYRYQQTRFNGLGIGWEAQNARMELCLGGNIHNQAMANAEITWLPQPEKIESGVSLVQEFRSMDSHWLSPVSITAIKLTSETPLIKARQATAISYLPEDDTTPEHIEIYHQSELQLRLTKHLHPGIGIMYLNREYTPKTLERYQAYLEYTPGSFTILPLTELTKVNSTSLWQHRLTAFYQILPQSKVGLFYEYSRQNSSQAVHSIGIEADLSYFF